MFELIGGLVKAGYRVELRPQDEDGDYQVIISDGESCVAAGWGTSLTDAIGSAVTALIPSISEGN